MKKIMKYLSASFVAILIVFVTSNKVLADMLPPGKFDEVPADERANFFEIVQPQYILIGITIILAIWVSFVLLAKLRDSDKQNSEK